MCGIAGVHRKTDRPVQRLNTLVTELLLAIENRGRDATGYVAIDDEGGVQIEKICVPARKFVDKKRRIRADARSVLMHTRFATTGRQHATEDAHPQTSGSVYCTHNGTVWNDDELFKDWGMARHAQVDTEVIPALISQVSGWEDIGGALELLEGGAAVALADTDRPTELALARTRDYPLVYVDAKDYIVWASTPEAIERAWHKAFGRKPKKETMKRLGEGEVLRVRAGIVSIEKFKVNRPKITVRNWDPDQTGPSWNWSRGKGGARLGSVAAHALGLNDPDVQSVEEWLAIRDARENQLALGRGKSDDALADALVEAYAEQGFDIQNMVSGPYDDMDSVERDELDGAAILLTEERCDDCGGYTTMARFRWESILCPDCYEATRDLFEGGQACEVIPIAKASSKKKGRKTHARRS